MGQGNQGDRWDAGDYEQSSSAQLVWARELIAKLNLQGDECVLDLGCGDGKITAEIAKLLPKGSAVGIDSSQAMAQVEEAQRQYAQINAILVQAIDKLEPLTQQILQLYYSSEDRKQEQVAQILGITQPKVARRSIKARKTLLKALLQWSGKELDPPLDSDRAKERSEALSEWLRKYYRPQ